MNDAIKNLAFISTFLFFSGMLAMVAAQDEQLPLEIDADTSTCATDLKDCVLEGNVIIRQGDASISADKLYSQSETAWELEGNIVIQKTGMSINAENAKVALEERQLNNVQLLGSPVQFSYLVDNQGKANGQADSVAFDLNRRIITLDGNARLVEGGNELTGEHIEYDLNKERLKAKNQSGNEQGRVHLIFEPPEKKKEPATDSSNQN